LSTKPSRPTALLVLAVVGACLTTAGAAERETVCRADCRFSSADFCDADTQLTGVFFTEVPEEGTLRCGSRTIRPGDALCAGRLSSLQFVPSEECGREAEIRYLPVTGEGVGAVQTLKLKLPSGKDEAPTADDGTLETYKNIPNSGTLQAADPEGEALQYTLSSAPKRGTVELAADGTFTYTPAKNKVGKDSFTFTATDPAGNVSNEATVRIEILKPTDKLRYSDMSGDPDQFHAIWLHDRGVYSGEEVAGVRCFCPDKAVTRGEFLVMAAQLTGLEPDKTEMVSGFADEAETPEWMRPYIVSALRSGVITGSGSARGLVFRPAANLTGAEAAVMLQNILRLPEVQDAAAFPEDSTVPAWAEGAVSALSGAGVSMDCASCSEPVTRREAARLLYEACRLQEVKDAF